MGMTDPIADMLTRIRNANHRKHPDVEMPASNVKLEILKVMQDEGFIGNIEEIQDNKQGLLKVTLKYTENKEQVIKGITRISKPGLRVYARASEMPRVLNGLGVAIVSTSNGVMTDREARKLKVGGEVIAYIW
ncbi:MAG: 30S ribosomal protein S8 [Bacilli bacterium]|jgi:small subunit ribosomal protein S8|nr:30S ribosomal protein S8 [Bacilli bacterium]MDD2681632.1 30S ribosomal protein S8 [Bacilli bacterium]MDD3120973.1 30S ribosomal protein S8 [Bacilli bacterium]MDD4063147.1 30S ribosomal protein S8 [Bacilli bacterium]MDD4481787.1 30S ribosomal protein S8 [Bacilli bacterium]